MRERVRMIGTERLVRAIDERTVGADVAQEPGAGTMFYLGVASRNVALGIAQHPVVARGTADASAVDAERPARLVAGRGGVVADDFQPERHRPYNNAPTAGRPPSGS